jgi:hypothetical protein
VGNRKDRLVSEKIAPRFRKTKSDKWAVMAPVEDLERALAEGGKIDVQKRSGDWSTFQVASLGKPFDVDGVQMCYGYGPEADDGGSGSEPDGATAGDRTPSAGGTPTNRRDAPRRPTPGRRPPPTDPSEPLPEYQGGQEDEWDGGF